MHKYLAKGVMLSVSIVVVTVIVGIIINVFGLIKDTALSTQRLNENRANIISNEKYDIYDGKDVYGDTVYVAATSFNSEEFVIVIKNNLYTYSIGNKIAGSLVGTDGTFLVNISTLQKKDGYYIAEFEANKYSTANYSILKTAGKTYVDYRKMYRATLIRDISYSIVGIVFELK